MGKESPIVQPPAYRAGPYARFDRAAPSRYLHPGSLAVDNNPVERAPPPVAPGRKSPPSCGRDGGRRGPGMGIALDEDARAGKLGSGKERESYDADGGSVVDWCGFLPISHLRCIVG